MRYIILLFSLFLAFSANAKSLQVLASYPPIQSLVLGVTNGIEPVGVIYRNSSAGHHDVPLKPSQMKALKRADVLFWAGPELENNIPEALAKLNTKLISVPLMEQTQGLSFEPLATDAQKNDPHFWLDPDNALKALDQILKVMIELDPNNRAAYEKNATHYKEVLQRLQDLNTVDKNKKFVALHSGFDYFFKSFGLNGTTMNIDPEQIKTPAEKRQFFEKLKSENPACVIVEPAMTKKQIRALGLDDYAIVKIDAFGWPLKNPHYRYYQLMKRNLWALDHCRKK